MSGLSGKQIAVKRRTHFLWFLIGYAAFFFMGVWVGNQYTAAYYEKVVIGIQTISKNLWGLVPGAIILTTLFKNIKDLRTRRSD